MSTTATSHVKTSNSANILMCKQWWKVCWMYGDQEKYYRQLYGRRKIKNDFLNFDNVDSKRPGAEVTNLTDEFFEEGSQIEPTPHEEDERNELTFGAESEPIYGFDYQTAWQRDQRRQPITQNYEYMNTTDLDKICISANSVKNILQAGLPLDSGTTISKEDDSIRNRVTGKRKGFITEEIEMLNDGKPCAGLKFQRFTTRSDSNKLKEALQPLKEEFTLDECSRRKCVGDEFTATLPNSVIFPQTPAASCNE